MKKQGSILIVDDNRSVLVAAKMLLENYFESVITTSIPDRIRSILQENEIGVILLAAGVIAIAVPESTINDLGFLSMGLRGTVVFLPLSCALWLKGRIAPVCILVSIVLAPVAVLVGNWMTLPFDALFLGMLVSLAYCVVGWVLGRNAGRRQRI